MINYPPNDVTTLHGQTARDGQAIEATQALAMGRLGCATDGHCQWPHCTMAIGRLSWRWPWCSVATVSYAKTVAVANRCWVWQAEVRGGCQQ